MTFWETLPGLIASWAAAVAGLLYLTRKGWRAAKRSWKWLRRFVTAVDRLLEIGVEDVWPNGSKTLAQSVTTIYNRLEAGVERFDQLDEAQARNYELLEAYIKTHRQDHEILNRPA